MWPVQPKAGNRLFRQSWLCERANTMASDYSAGLNHVQSRTLLFACQARSWGGLNKAGCVRNDLPSRCNYHRTERVKPAPNTGSSVRNSLVTTLCTVSGKCIGDTGFVLRTPLPPPSRPPPKLRVASRSALPMTPFTARTSQQTRTSPATPRPAGQPHSFKRVLKSQQQNQPKKNKKKKKISCRKGFGQFGASTKEVHGRVVASETGLLSTTFESATRATETRHHAAHSKFCTQVRPRYPPRPQCTSRWLEERGPKCAMLATSATGREGGVESNRANIYQAKGEPVEIHRCYVQRCEAGIQKSARPKEGPRRGHQEGAGTQVRGKVSTTAGISRSRSRSHRCWPAQHGSGKGCCRRKSNATSTHKCQSGSRRPQRPRENRGTLRCRTCSTCSTCSTSKICARGPRGAGSDQAGDETRTGTRRHFSTTTTESTQGTSSRRIAAGRRSQHTRSSRRLQSSPGSSGGGGGQHFLQFAGTNPLSSAIAIC